MQPAELFVGLLAAYLGAGAVFAAVFVVAGVERVDPAARHATWGFRLMILPRVAALWPLLLEWWIKRRST